MRQIEHKVSQFAYASDRGVYTDVPLSNFASMAFASANSMEGFIAEQLIPAFGVPKQSGYYPVIDAQAFQRVEGGALRAPRTKANKVNWTLSSAQFFAPNYAFSHDIALEDMSNEDASINLRNNGITLVVGGLKLLQENRCATLLTTNANVGSSVNLTTAAAGLPKFSDFVNSDPLAVVSTAQAFVRQRTGLIPNTAAIDYDTMSVLKRHPALIDYFKYTAGGLLPNALIAELFGVPADRLYVASGIKENQNEGLGASSVTNIWGNMLLFAYVGPNLGQQSQTPFARFQWQQNGIYPDNLGVMTSVDDSAGGTHSEIIEVGHFQAEVMVAKNLCYLIKNTL